MIQLPHHDLPDEALSELAAFQREIDALPTHAERVRAAEEQWENKRKRRVFEVVRELLSAMCSGPGRCMYCEDNGAYQIEHFRPKTLYPGLVFAWANYLYACGQCNGLKGKQFAVFSENGTILALFRSNSEPPEGPPVLLDPRRDEPMDYLWLDLLGTFLFKPMHPRGSLQCERADYTISKIGLNSRDDLVKSREDAYGHYRARLNEYRVEKQKNAVGAKLDRMRNALRRLSHATVWREMKRQHRQIDELNELFSAVPEALAW